MYKSIFPFLLTLSFCSFLSAQSSTCDLATYNDFIAKGQAYVEQGDYIQAFEYYNSAKDYCPGKGKVVDSLVQMIIVETVKDKRIRDSLFTEVYVEQQKTKTALVETKKAYHVADSLYRKAEKLVNAFYFYEGRFALAYGKKIETMFSIL